MEDKIAVEAADLIALWETCAELVCGSQQYEMLGRVAAALTFAGYTNNGTGRWEKVPSAPIDFKAISNGFGSVATLPEGYDERTRWTHDGQGRLIAAHPEMPPLMVDMRTEPPTLTKITA